MCTKDDKLFLIHLSVGKEEVVFQTTYCLHPFMISISLSLPLLSLAAKLIRSTRLTNCRDTLLSHNSHIIILYTIIYPSYMHLYGKQTYAALYLNLKNLCLRTVYTYDPWSHCHTITVPVKPCSYGVYPSICEIYNMMPHSKTA